ncbi:MAG: hypothetical protein ACMG6S_13690 [Byssovorax sp.]
MERIVWEMLFEGCARIFGLTTRSRSLLLVAACLGLALVGVLGLEIWGRAGLLAPAALVLLGGAVALKVVEARDAAWRAACLPLDDPRQLPRPAVVTSPLAPTAVALHRLGIALDHVRRARYVAAHEALPRIDRSLLRPEEARRLDAVRALIALGLGDTRTAAQHAAAAIPTGSEELDACLGRAVIAESWHQPDRLRAIETEWSRAGIAPDQDSTLARLQRLTRLRVDVRLLEGVSAIEARALSTEARAVGDEELAADLEARARKSAYR